MCDENLQGDSYLQFKLMLNILSMIINHVNVRHLCLDLLIECIRMSIVSLHQHKPHRLSELRLISQCQLKCISIIKDQIHVALILQPSKLLLTILKSCENAILWLKGPDIQFVNASIITLFIYNSHIVNLISKEEIRGCHCM